jgi:hypothetical protein
MQDGRLVLGERVMQLSARNLPNVRNVVALGGVLACVAACNGTTGFGGSSSTGGGVSFGSADGPTSAPPSSTSPFPPSAAACPTNMPVEGDNCFGGTCEYGGAADPACNVVARCSAQLGTWTLEQPSHCASTCPAHFDEDRPGTSCSRTELCTYLEATCGCAGAIDGAWTSITGGSNNVTSDAGADASTIDGGDAGADAGAGAIGQWQCVRPGNGCPARRPVEGTRCTKAMDCDYGTCVFGVPLAMTCINERWTAVYVGSCP